MTMVKRRRYSNYGLKGWELLGWELLLAEARARFFYHLTTTNGLLSQEQPGQILEVDDGKSLLRLATRKYGLETHTVDSQTLLVDTYAFRQKYTLSVTHTLLEHSTSLSEVTHLLTMLAEHSSCMVHQVHEVDAPAFDWDATHRIKMTRREWSDFFTRWATSHEGWVYLGNHQGMNGRPSNYVLEKNGNVPFYKHYDKQLTRRLVKEITAANIVSLSRIPLLLTAFAVGKNNPPLLSALIGIVFALDAADGYVARKGFGNSPAGPHIDIVLDHIVELITVGEFAYEMGVIPSGVPWILGIRNVMTDFMRLYNAITFAHYEETHPHTSFGTSDTTGKFISGAVKTVEGITVPIIPSLGVYLSTAHVVTSLYRGLPVLLSDRSKRIYHHIFKRLAKKLQKL